MSVIDLRSSFEEGLVFWTQAVKRKLKSRKYFLQVFVVVVVVGLFFLVGGCQRDLYELWNIDAEYREYISIG